MPKITGRDFTYYVLRLSACTHKRDMFFGNTKGPVFLIGRLLTLLSLYFPKLLYVSRNLRAIDRLTVSRAHLTQFISKFLIWSKFLYFAQMRLYVRQNILRVHNGIINS